MRIGPAEIVILVLFVMMLILAVRAFLRGRSG